MIQHPPSVLEKQNYSRQAASDEEQSRRPRIERCQLGFSQSSDALLVLAGVPESVVDQMHTSCIQATK